MVLIIGVRQDLMLILNFNWPNWKRNIKPIYPQIWGLTCGFSIRGRFINRGKGLWWNMVILETCILRWLGLNSPGSPTRIRQLRLWIKLFFQQIWVYNLWITFAEQHLALGMFPFASKDQIPISWFNIAIGRSFIWVLKSHYIKLKEVVSALVPSCNLYHSFVKCKIM